MKLALGVLVFVLAMLVGAAITVRLAHYSQGESPCYVKEGIMHCPGDNMA